MGVSTWGPQTVKRIDLAQKIVFVMSSPWLLTYIATSPRPLRWKTGLFTFPSPLSTIFGSNALKKWITFQHEQALPRLEASSRPFQPPASQRPLSPSSASCQPWPSRRRASPLPLPEGQGLRTLQSEQNLQKSQVTTIISSSSEQARDTNFSLVVVRLTKQIQIDELWLH